MDYILWLYLATRLDGIGEFFGWMTFLSFATVMIAWGVIALTYIILSDPPATEKSFPELVKEFQELRAKMYPWRKWGIVVFLIFGFVYALTPTKKDAMFIAGGVGVIEGVKILKDSTIANTSVKIVEEWLNTNLRELQDKARGKEKAK